MECKYPVENRVMGENWLSTDNIYSPYYSPTFPFVSPCIAIQIIPSHVSIWLCCCRIKGVNMLPIPYLVFLG